MSKAKKNALPQGLIIIDGVEQAAPPELVAAVLAGWAAKQAKDDATADLDGCNVSLMEMMSDAGHGGAIVVPGVCRATLVHREAVKITDAERLQALLGPRWRDLVTESVNYKAEARLIDMATDGDEPMQPAIAACLEIKESDAVMWRAEK